MFDSYLNAQNCGDERDATLSGPYLAGGIDYSWRPGNRSRDEMASPARSAEHYMVLSDRLESDALLDVQVTTYV